MTKRRRPAALLVLLFSGAACVWPSPERQLLIEYFYACQIYDTTVIARLSTVPCNPRIDGVVENFELVGVKDAGQLESGEPARQVTIRARVRSLDELSTEERTLVVRLERRDGRWMVTGLMPSPASRTSPAASSGRPR